MKKNIAKIVALVVVVAMCAVVLAACVPSDYSKAKANLEENGYTVTVAENGKLLNAAKIAGETFAAILDVKLEGTCTQVVSAANKDGEAITIYYFDNTADAKAFKASAKSYIDEEKAEIEKAYKDGKISEEEYNKSKEDMKNTKYGASGKAFYMGSAAAVKAAN